MPKTAASYRSSSQPLVYESVRRILLTAALSVKLLPRYAWEGREAAPLSDTPCALGRVFPALVEGLAQHHEGIQINAGAA